MSEKKPQTGEWWECDFTRVRIVGHRLDGVAITEAKGGFIGCIKDLTEWKHLPDCDSFEWKPETFPQWYVSGKMCGWGFTAYVVRDTATTYFCVETNGKETRDACFTWDQSLVASGAWKQTTQAEAESLVTKPPLPQEPPKPNYVRLWTHRSSGTVCTATGERYLAYPEIWIEVKHDGTGFYLADDGK